MFLSLSMAPRSEPVSRIVRSSILTCIVIAITGCAPVVPVEVALPPSALKLNPFYQQYLDADGIPITASSQVPTAALVDARDIVEQMLAHRSDIRLALVKLGARIAIMAQNEYTTDLPEQRDWKKPEPDDPVLTVCERKHYDERIGRLSDRDYWNARARGMGGLLTSGAAENLLAVPGTRYYGENIFVHEFSHEIMGGIRHADPELERRVKEAYADAHQRGIWKGEYIDTNFEEYWAEGTQFWFNSNKIIVIDGHRILSSDDLKIHDPRLYALLREVYGNRHHLRGDAFYNHPARVPKGILPTSTAERC